MNPGEVVGHYKILEPLGKGGMGEVFVAEDTRLHRKVALKVLPPLFAADPTYRERFEREARAVAALNHPNIVTIHSVEDADGRPFLTMELVDGKPLSELIPRGGMPLNALLRVGMEVADAVAAAQEQGITHRDLKPANVIVTPSGRAKVLDFGLAKMKDAAPAPDSDMTRIASSEITGEGKILGTVAYMSPEQAEGKAVDTRSDIFSLGVMLHEMATGERPFKGDSNVSILSSILKDTPAAVTDSNPALPVDLARIVRRCLAKDPGRRYQTAADLRNELEDLKQDTASAVISGVGHARPSTRRLNHAWVGMALAGLAVAAVALFLLSRARGGSGAAETFTIDRIQRLTTTGTAFLAAISPDGRYVVHAKVENSLPALWTRQTATTSDVRIVAPEDVRFDGVTITQDGNYVYYDDYPGSGAVGSLFKVPVLGGAPVKLLEDVDSPVAFSPDQKRMAFMRGVAARGTTSLMVADADGANVRVLAEPPLSERFLSEGPSWSPDGKTILAPASSARPGVPAAVHAVDAASGKMQQIGAPWAAVRDVAWLPDGRAFLVTGIDFSGLSSFQIWRVAYPSGDRVRVTNDLNSYVGVSVSADGASLATVQAEVVAGVYVADGPDREPRKISGGPSRADGTNGLAWMPDGRLLYTSSASGLPQIWIADGDGGSARQLTSMPTLAINPQAAPDGAWVYFSSYTREGWCLFRIAPGGGTPEQLTKDGDARGEFVSADGKTLFYTAVNSGTPRLMQVAAGGGTPQRVADVFFRVQGVSPDGTRLIGLTWSEERKRAVLAILDLAGRKMDVRPDWPTNTLFLPDGGFTNYQRIQGKSVVMVWPASGSAFRPDTPPHPEFVYGTAVSRDGRVAFSRGQQISDVVLIKRKTGT